MGEAEKAVSLPGDLEFRQETRHRSGQLREIVSLLKNAIETMYAA
jgi:hypothetical protein